MANLIDLKHYGDEIIPVIRDLFANLNNNQAQIDIPALETAFAKADKLASEASQKTTRLLRKPQAQ